MKKNISFFYSGILVGMFLLFTTPVLFFLLSRPTKDQKLKDQILTESLLKKEDEYRKECEKIAKENDDEMFFDLSTRTPYKPTFYCVLKKKRTFINMVYPN